MLQFFHKNQKSALLIFIALIVCLAMLLFGMNPTGPSTQRDAYAIKINGQEIKQTDYYTEKRNLEDSYRRRMGNFYDQLIESGAINPSQQTLDNLINSTLLRQFAMQQDLFTSQGSIKEYIGNFFGDNLSRDSYRTFLKNTGQTAERFESSLGYDLLPEVLLTIINDHNNISDNEIKHLITKEETQYVYQKAVIDPSKLIEQVTEPSEEELKEYYEENAAIYEEPDKVTYQYLIYDPEQHLDLVDLPEEEIEIYYADNIDQFKVKPTAKIRQIVINFDASNPEEQIKTKTRAEELLEKINAGEDFAELAKKNSDDSFSKKKGGDAGWVTKGTRSEAFDQVAFDMDAMGTAKLVEEADRFIVIRVEDFKDEHTKELSEVSEQIKKDLQRRDAPSYVLIKAQDDFDTWTDENGLDKIAEANKLKTSKTTSALSTDNDPEPRLKGLSEQVLNFVDEPRQILEVGDLVILTEVIEYMPRKIPELEEVKAKLLEDYKKEQSNILAEDKASSLLAKLEESPETELASLSDEFTAEVATSEELKPAQRKDELNDEEIHKAIFGSDQPGLIAQAYPFSNKYYVFKVTQVTPPSEEDVQSKVEGRRNAALQNNSRILVESIINKLRANADIEIASGLIGS